VTVVETWSTPSANPPPRTDEVGEHPALHGGRAARLLRMS
jgi:hypothetical protein